MRANHHRSWESTLCEGSIKQTPYFQNHCNHLPNEYVGSAQFWRGAGNADKLDVYIHGDDQEVCIRTGNRGGAYASVGTVADLIMACAWNNTSLYRAALAIIDKTCELRIKKIQLLGKNDILRKLRHELENTDPASYEYADLENDIRMLELEQRNRRMNMSIVEVLMERDGMSRENAVEAVEEAQIELRERIADGDYPYDLCEELFGLEPDYLMELI